MVRNAPANAGDLKGTVRPLGQGDPWGRAWQPLQCSSLENPMNRGGWGAAGHGATKIRIRLKRLGTHTVYTCQRHLSTFPALSFPSGFHRPILCFFVPVGLLTLLVL